MKIRKRDVDALKPPEPNKAGYVLHYDEKLPGFCLKVTTAGIKTFVLDKRIYGRSRRITLGRYGPLTADQARKDAKKYLGQIASGGDPVADKARRKLTAKTLDECFNEYVNNRRRKDGKALKERTKRDMLQAMNESFSDWKHRSITTINRDMVKHRYAERAKMSIARTNIAMRYLRAVLNFAIAAYRDAEGRPVLTDNPVRVLSESSLWQGIEARDRTLGDNDLSTWLPAVQALGETPARNPGEGKQKPRLRHGEIFRDFFLFLALTGARKSEAMELRKRDLGYLNDKGRFCPKDDGESMRDGAVVRFPDTKNRRDHILPLTPYLRALLERRVKASPSELVFVATDGRTVSNLRYAIERITEDSGVKFSPHDLRRTAATILERAGIPVYTTKAVLNHLPGAADVTGRYVQVKPDMKLAALEKINNFIIRHAKGGGKVVPLRGKKAS